MQSSVFVFAGEYTARSLLAQPCSVFVFAGEFTGLLLASLAMSRGTPLHLSIIPDAAAVVTPQLVDWF